MRTFLTVLCLCVASAYGQSQPPSPTPTLKGTKPQKPTANSQEQTNADERGTEKSPVVVKVLPSPKTQEETSDDKAKDLDQSSANWWMVRLTGGVVFIGLIQTLVFWLQARRLKETIEKMDAIAAGQTADIRASIDQAARAATAMEQVAKTLSVQTTDVHTGLELTRQSANAATKSAEMAERSLIATQRALVVMAEINTGVVIGANRELVGFAFFILFKNSGNTMALDAECTATLICGLKSVADIAHDESPVMASSSSMPIGPNVSVSTDSKAAIGIDEIERIRKNESAAFIHGRVDYRDVFENTPRRTTTVCARITLRDDPTIRTTDGFNTRAFAFIAGPPEHNRST